MVGLALFAVASLAILGLIIQSAKLDVKEEENTQISAVAQQLMELEVDKARDHEGYDSLANVLLTPTSDPDYLYEETVTDVSDGLKKVTVTLYYADPNNPNTADITRPKAGECFTLSTIIGEPTQ